MGHVSSGSTVRACSAASKTRNLPHFIARLVAKRHHQTEVLPGKLLRIDARPCLERVVEWRQLKSPAGMKKEAEVLRMSVCGTQEPENDVCLQDVLLVGKRFVTTPKQLKNLLDPGSSIRLVFSRRRNGKRLAAIFQRKVKKPSI